MYAIIDRGFAQQVNGRGIDKSDAGEFEARPSGTSVRGTGARVLTSERVPRRRNRSTIDLDGSRENVRYWTTALACTEGQLRAAVVDVGVDPERVRVRLGK
jgi:Protein of unknown function (DUF3606)